MTLSFIETTQSNLNIHPISLINRLIVLSLSLIICCKWSYKTSDNIIYGMYLASITHFPSSPDMLLASLSLHRTSSSQFYLVKSSMLCDFLDICHQGPFHLLGDRTCCINVLTRQFWTILKNIPDD